MAPRHAATDRTANWQSAKRSFTISRPACGCVCGARASSMSSESGLACGWGTLRRGRGACFEANGHRTSTHDKSGPGEYSTKNERGGRVNKSTPQPRMTTQKRSDWNNRAENDDAKRNQQRALTSLVQQQTEARLTAAAPAPAPAAAAVRRSDRDDVGIGTGTAQPHQTAAKPVQWGVNAERMKQNGTLLVRCLKARKSQAASTKRLELEWKPHLQERRRHGARPRGRSPIRHLTENQSECARNKNSSTRHSRALRTTRAGTTNSVCRQAEATAEVSCQ